MSEGENSYSVELATTEAELLSLREDWGRLSETAPLPNVFTTFEWYHAWLVECARDPESSRREPAVFTIRREGVLVGLLPLVRRVASRGGLRIRKLEFLQASADYNDGLFVEDPVGQLQAVFTRAARLCDFDLIDLVNVRCATGTSEALQQALAASAFCCRLGTTRRCPCFRIEVDWPGWIRLRKGRDRFDRMGSEFQIRVSDRPHAEPGLLGKIRTLEAQKKILGQAIPAFLGRYPDAFQDLFDTLGPRGWLYVGLMEHQGQPIACELGFRCGDKLWVFFKAFDHAFSRHSPGTILFSRVVEYGLRNGFGEYDYLIGEDEYKLRFSTGKNHTVRVMAWPDVWSAHCKAYVYFDLKPLLHRLASGGSRGQQD